MILLFFVDQGFGKKKATCPQLETWGISLQDMEPLKHSYKCCTGSCPWERLSVRDADFTIINQSCQLVAMASIMRGFSDHPLGQVTGGESNLDPQCNAKKWQTHLALSPSWSEPRRWPNSWARRRAITRPWFPDKNTLVFLVSLSKFINKSSARWYHNFQVTCD